MMMLMMVIMMMIAMMMIVMMMIVMMMVVQHVWTASWMDALMNKLMYVMIR